MRFVRRRRKARERTARVAHLGTRQSDAMTIGRRRGCLGDGVGAGKSCSRLGLALAAAAGPRDAAGDAERATFSTYGIVPGDGIDQTASLQEAADRAAQSGTPFFLPPGGYTTAKLALKSGTQIQGVPGKSVLRYTGGGALICDRRCGGHPPDRTDACTAKQSRSTAARCSSPRTSKASSSRTAAFSAALQDGVVLRKVSGRVTDCEIGDIRGGGLFSEDAGRARNRAITMCAIAATTASSSGAR